MLACRSLPCRQLGEGSERDDPCQTDVVVECHGASQSVFDDTHYTKLAFL